jgi:hypothetical protein
LNVVGRGRVPPVDVQQLDQHGARGQDGVGLGKRRRESRWVKPNFSFSGGVSCGKGMSATRNNNNNNNSNSNTTAIIMIM